MKKALYYICFILIIALIIVLNFLKISIFENEVFNEYFKVIFTYLLALPIIFYLLHRLDYKLFNKKIAKFGMICFALSMLVAINNFPFFPFFKKTSTFEYHTSLEIITFIIYCIMTAVFEETLFRGMLFNYMVETFSKDKKGIAKAIIFSGLTFGIAHLLNLFSGAGFLATLGQVGYTTLIGAMCAFILYKTRNIVFPIIVHAVYNILGLMLSSSALGSGIVFDIETIVLTAVLGVIVGVSLLMFLLKSTDIEAAEYNLICINLAQNKKTAE